MPGKVNLVQVKSKSIAQCDLCHSSGKRYWSKCIFTGKRLHCLIGGSIYQVWNVHHVSFPMLWQVPPGACISHSRHPDSTRKYEQISEHHKLPSALLEQFCQCDSSYFRPKALFKGEGKEMVKIYCSQVNPASLWFLSEGTICKRCYLWPWWSKTSAPEKAWQEKMLPWQPENPKQAAPHYPASMPMEWAPGARAGRGAFSLHA